ncbi:alpha/beta fold hydrolase [Nonomuraea sp. NPDC050310]|uniref:alpha/beta fold hydrolase n=1 Tax=unclassified Nonomuraea TaxID=2593643 RepID=UPI0033CE2A3E
MGLYSRRFGTPGGRAVLLVHGFASDGWRDWVATGTARDLALRGFDVTVPDLRGHGESPPFDDAAQAHAPAQAAELLGLMEGEFDVVGYSLGARLAWELPVLAPERVGRVILGGLAPVEPFATVDPDQIGRDGDDPLTSMIPPELATCVRGLRETPFEPAGWAGATPPVLVAGADDVMTWGIERIVELAGGARLVRVPGGHAEALTGAEFRAAIVEVLER